MSATKQPQGSQPHSPLLAIQLPNFEGPLDLLLHLVREHRLDIFDIPVSFITERYLEMIDRMRELDLDVAGEFLVMAATLAHLKSRMLLPKPPIEDEEGAEEGDPRSDLVRRLLEYQKYKAAGEALSRLDRLGRDVFTHRVPRDPSLSSAEARGLKEVSVFKLIETLAKVMARAEIQAPHQVTVERASLSDRIQSLISRFRVRRSAGFLQLFDGARFRHEVIVTFLALLEMTRLGLLRIHQEEAEAEILVSATELVEAVSSEDVRDDFR